MKVIIQRVTSADVKVEGVLINEINMGFHVLVGFEQDEMHEEMEWLANKMVNLRIFDDQNGVPNLSINDVVGEILLISQFTLHAQTKKGNRPSYIKAAKPEKALAYYNSFCEILNSKMKGTLKKGVFGAEMITSLVCTGPLTIYMDTKNKQ